MLTNSYNAVRLFDQHAYETQEDYPDKNWKDFRP